MIRKDKTESKVENAIRKAMNDFDRAVSSGLCGGPGLLERIETELSNRNLLRPENCTCDNPKKETR